MVKAIEFTMQFQSELQKSSVQSDSQEQHLSLNSHL